MKENILGLCLKLDEQSNKKDNTVDDLKIPKKTL
jgi:hypothetical protein